MDNDVLQQVSRIFGSIPEVKLGYFFGSRANGKGGPLSDYDFAVYVDEPDQKKVFDIIFSLSDKISRLLKTDRVDIVALNAIDGPELKYQIISQGKLIFEQEPYKVLIEPRILNEYFDFRMVFLKHQ